MENYREQLKIMGIADSRTEDLAVAMDNLVGAICKLDFKNLHTFSSKLGIGGHLDLYCKAEGIRNVAQEMYDINLKRASKRINFTEFSEFSDRLFHLADQATEAGIPGASTLCRSLCDLRKNYENGDPHKDTMFVRLAKKYELNEIEYGLTAENLSVRDTYQYIGSSRHLDDWTAIGTCTVLSRQYRKTSDCADTGTDLLFLKVRSDSPVEDVKRAIGDTFSWLGCSCEHDCCGCLSQSARRMKRLFRDVWAVELSWFRNY